MEYAEFLFIRSRSKSEALSQNAAYTLAATLSTLFGSILNIPSTIRLINRTRLQVSPSSKKAVSRKAEKQNLEATFKQGNFLVDLVNGLSKDAIHGPLPITISIRPGLVENDRLLLYAGLQNLEIAPHPKSEWAVSQKGLYSEALRRRAPVGDIKAKKFGAKRWLLVNLSVQAEFLIFIAQTGMNLTQAKDLGREALKYKPLGDSWQVRCYKNRKGGEVSFRIYKSYKPFLDNYRAFINHFFPESELMFPLFDSEGDKESAVRNGLVQFRLVRRLLEEHAIPWVAPSQLRNTRVNWLLRRSGDADLASEMAQHTQEVLKQQYELPSQQRAMVEVTQFWNKHDPIEQGDLRASVIASSCNGNPKAAHDKPGSVVEPNCINPSGCLWCVHQRDLDCGDYVWSLASMRHLKGIEAGTASSKVKTPADHAVDRISAKLAWFRSSTPERAGWVEEALERVEEGAYHPNWAPVIEFLEQA